MPKLEMNLNDVPLEIPVIAPGLYTLQCIQQEMKETKKGDNQMLVLTFKVIENDEFKDRRLTDYCVYTTEMGATRLKRAIVACGVQAGEDGLDTEDFLNTCCQAVINNRVYQDPTTGDTRQQAQIKDYVVPAE